MCLKYTIIGRHGACAQGHFHDLAMLPEKAVVRTHAERGVIGSADKLRNVCEAWLTLHPEHLSQGRKQICSGAWMSTWQSEHRGARWLPGPTEERSQ